MLEQRKGRKRISFMLIWKSLIEKLKRNSSASKWNFRPLLTRGEQPNTAEQRMPRCPPVQYKQLIVGDHDFDGISLMLQKVH